MGSAARSFFSRVFSAPRSFSRLASDTFIPPNLLRQRYPRLVSHYPIALRSLHHGSARVRCTYLNVRPVSGSATCRRSDSAKPFSR